MSTLRDDDSPKIWQKPWVKGLLIVCALLAMLAVGIEAYRRIDRYARRSVAQEVAKLPVVLEFKHAPDWLDESLLKMILQEAVAMVRRDEATYAQFQNPMESAVLKKIARYYEDPKNRTVRQNAWIKRIVSIERVPMARYQKIEITAEFRRPIGWVNYGNQYYLIDDEGVRLPGEYNDAERNRMGKLLVIAGIELPRLEGEANPDAPAPGKRWETADADAGLALMKILNDQPFRHQIATINVSNFNGRVNKLAPQIVLDTVFNTSVLWGRPARDEQFFEVSLQAKLKALQMIFVKFSRIDAGRPYVDIRLDQVKVPSVANGGPQGSVEGLRHIIVPMSWRRT